MDTDGILKALEGGEFDGVSHHYQPYKGYGKTTYQKSMSVSGGAIDVAKTTRSKFFDGKENVRTEGTETETLTGTAAVSFIAQHPYYFQQVRPDLF
jgi:hypothetical protein